MSDDLPVVRAARPVAVVGGLADRRFVWFAALILALTAFNLLFRIGSEFVSEWDESLYAITASEALQKGNWIGTTFLGSLDYYNSKPPLNIWLIAAAFKLFGTNLFALRIVSVLAAWATVAVLMVWSKRLFGSAVSLVAGFTLATSFGFVHVHSGRSANTDALFTLLLLLVVVTLWSAERRPALRIWLGPIVAGIFLLRGMAVLMPLCLIGAMLLIRRRRPDAPPVWRTNLSAVALFVLPVGLWIVARYQVDGWLFLRPLFWYDFVARTVSSLESHPGGPFYYLGILAKHQYDWLLAALVALLVLARGIRAHLPSSIREAIAAFRSSPTAVVLSAWAAATLVIPAVMQTKVPWYLNPFYPLFAIAVAVAVVRALEHTGTAAVRGRVLVGALALLALVAETKLVAYSFQYRDLRLSDQGVLMAERKRLTGRKVYRDSLSRGATFVATHIVGATALDVPDSETFIKESQPDDYLMTTRTISDPDVELIRTGGGFNLYRRCEPRGRPTLVDARR